MSFRSWPSGETPRWRSTRRRSHLVVVVLAAFQNRAPLWVRSAFWIVRLSRVAASEHVGSDPLFQFVRFKQNLFFHRFSPLLCFGIAAKKICPHKKKPLR